VCSALLLKHAPVVKSSAGWFTLFHFKHFYHNSLS
jgi:hypothetical protein